jgi:hypothetical protein
MVSFAFHYGESGHKQTPDVHRRQPDRDLIAFHYGAIGHKQTPDVHRRAHNLT